MVSDDDIIAKREECAIKMTRINKSKMNILKDCQTKLDLLRKKSDGTNPINDATGSPMTETRRGQIFTRLSALVDGVSV